LATKLICSSGLVFLLLLAGSTTGQSTSPTPPTSITSTSAVPAAQQAQPANPPAGNASAAQEQKPDDSNSTPSDDAVTTIRATTNEVNVVFTVTDKHGRRITDLKQNDFRVLDDNKPPQEIRSFHAETNLPLQVGLLIDASNSVRDRFKFEQSRLSSFSTRPSIPAKIRHLWLVLM
jgi:Ca-activated chloride channel homolog